MDMDRICSQLFPSICQKFLDVLAILPNGLAIVPITQKDPKKGEV